MTHPSAGQVPPDVTLSRTLDFMVSVCGISLGLWLGPRVPTGFALTLVVGCVAGLLWLDVRDWRTARG